MIISHSKKFVFLHGRKTAGSSIGISLLRYLEPGDICRGYTTGGLAENIRPPEWNKSLPYLRPRDLFSPGPRVRAYRRYVKHTYGISSTHMTVPQAREYLGRETWNSYFKFTFERNPFDRIVSFYFWRIRSRDEKPAFSDFVDAMYQQDEAFLRRYHLEGYSNLPFYMDGDQLGVDFVGRYEDLLPDCRTVFEKIGLTFDGWLPNNKSGIRPEGATHNKIASSGDIVKLKKIFSREIELFGYDVAGRDGEGDGNS